MRKFYSLLIPGILLLLAYSSFAQQKTVNEPPGLDAYVSRVMKTFQVPGMTIAIVKDGKVVMAKGFGVRKVGKAEPVDAHTLFAIASNSKAFTATAIALLVDEGKIKWDNPLIDYIPWFRLSNPYVTSQMTVRDLLVHHSGLGLGEGDLLLWPKTDYTARQIAMHLRYLPLRTSFRSTFAYDNVLYLVAGQLVKAVSGESWEDFVKSHIFDKIGMSESIDEITRLPDQDNYAAPNAIIDGELTLAKFHADDVTDPLGGICSNAVDMAKWMIVQLDSGQAGNGTRLFPAKETAQLWNMVSPIPVSKEPPYLAPLQENYLGYGLGFFLTDYRGYKMVYHPGGLTGYVSKVTMIPALKLGVAVLTNQESSDAYNAVIYHILDYYMHAPKFDWIGALKTAEAKSDSANKAEMSRINMSHDSTSGPSLPLEKYAGTYNDPWYGDVTISMEDGHLVMRFTHSARLVADLVHWQYDTFVARWRDRQLRADSFVTFWLNPDGSISSIRMKAVSPATDFSYDFRDLDLKPAAATK